MLEFSETPLPLEPGVTVCMWDLRAEPLRNGLIGRLVKWLPERERWQVNTTNLLKTGDETICVKPANLRGVCEPMDCEICHERILGDTCTGLCGHVFHAKCLHQWAKEYDEATREGAARCPLCRGWVGTHHEAGMILKPGAYLVQAMLGWSYQQAADVMFWDKSGHDEAVQLGMWVTKLLRRSPHALNILENDRKEHVAAPTRETGAAVETSLRLIVVFCIDAPKEGEEDYERARGYWAPFVRLTADWMLTLLGVYSPQIEPWGPGEFRLDELGAPKLRRDEPFFGQVV